MCESKRALTLKHYHLLNISLMNETDSFVQYLSYWSDAISHKSCIALLLGDIATGDIASV